MNILLIKGFGYDSKNQETIYNSLVDKYKEVNTIDLKDFDESLSLKGSYDKEQSKNDYIKDCQDKYIKADKIIFIYPIWWGTMPGKLKSLLEKVLWPGIIFDKVENKAPIPKFPNKKVISICSMESPTFLKIILPNKKLFNYIFKIGLKNKVKNYYLRSSKISKEHKSFNKIIKRA